MNVKKELFPESGKIIIEDGATRAIIVDMELDPIECWFPGGKTVVLNTDIYNEVHLSIENLRELIRLINEDDKIDL